MTHTTLKCTAMQSTSQAKIKRPTNYLYTLRVLLFTYIPRKSACLCYHLLHYSMCCMVIAPISSQKVLICPWRWLPYIYTNTYTNTNTILPSIFHHDLYFTQSNQGLFFCQFPCLKTHKIVIKKKEKTPSLPLLQVPRNLLSELLVPILFPLFHSPPNHSIQHLFHCMTMSLLIRQVQVISHWSIFKRIVTKIHRRKRSILSSLRRDPLMMMCQTFHPSLLTISWRKILIWLTVTVKAVIHQILIFPCPQHPHWLSILRVLFQLWSPKTFLKRLVLDSKVVQTLIWLIQTRRCQIYNNSKIILLSMPELPSRHLSSTKPPPPFKI